MNEFQIFAYISVALGFIVLAETLLIIISRYYLLGPEGMHFIKSRLAGTATDTIRHTPLTNTLHLDFANWDGEMFINKKGFYYPLRSVLNPQRESQKIYNDAISTASRWAGTGKPVIMLSDLFGFSLSTEFFSKLKQAKEPIDEDVKRFLENLEAHFNEAKIEYFSFVDTFSLNDIQEILISAGPDRLKETYQKGIRREKLKNTRLGGGGLPLPWVALAVVAVIVLAIFIQRAISNGAFG